MLLVGEGEHFSAGLDLSELNERDVTQGIAHSGLWHRAFEKIQFGKVPVVAVLHGAVVGGGLELAAAAHIRVAESSAYYALPEGSRGIYVGGGGSVRLPRLIGVARMMDMMLTGRTYSADEGHAMGLTTYLVEPGKGFAKGLDLAQRIAGNAPLTNFAVMQALPRIAEMDPAAALRQRVIGRTLGDADMRGRGKLKAAANHRAMQHGDNRHLSELNLLEGAMPQTGMGDALRDVAFVFSSDKSRPAEKCSPWPTQRHRTDAVRQRREELFDPDNGFVIERVAFLCGRLSRRIATAPSRSATSDDGSLIDEPLCHHSTSYTSSRTARASR